MQEKHLVRKKLRAFTFRRKRGLMLQNFSSEDISCFDKNVEWRINQLKMMNSFPN